MKQLLQKAQQLRLKYYRILQLADMPEDYAIQDYQTEWREAQTEVKQLFTYMSTHDLQPEIEVELLITIFLSLQIGYRNSELFLRATDKAFQLLPHLSPSKLKVHLLVHLYQETEDETLLPDIDHLLSRYQADFTTEEDHALLEYWQSVEENAASVIF